MKKWFALLIICFFILIHCKAAHDNEYDPDNPDKASLEGNVYDFDGSPLENSWVAITYDDSNYIEEYTDHQGWYGFDLIDPGIYRIIAQHEYYGPFEYYPESLPAGAIDTLDIQFCTAYWDFENEPLHAQEPIGWNVAFGTWSVVDDHDQCHVYNGITPGTGLAVALTDIVLDDFYYESMIKVDTSSGNTFVAGLMFRYQDNLNYYCVIFLVDRIELIESDSGLWTPLDTVWRSFSLDTWYALAVDCRGSQIQVFLDGQTTPLFDISSNAFTHGRVGLFAEYNSSISFDDIYIDVSQ
jgi:hypothetical protein